MKTKFRVSKSLVLLAILFLSVMTLAFANGDKEKTAKGDKPVPLRFVLDYSEESDVVGTIVYPMLREYQKANPMVDLTTEYASGDDLKTKIRVEVAAGSVPDVFMYWMTISNSQQLHDGDIVLETEEYIKVSPNVKMDQFTDSALAVCTRNGVTRGLPYLGYKMYFIINKALYEKYNVPVPRTYEEFREGGKIFLKNGIIPLAMGSRSGNPSHFWFSELMCQLDNGLEDLGNLSSTGVFNTPAALRTAEIIAEDVSLGMYPKDPIAAGLWDPPFALFVEGKAAATYSATWMLDKIDENFINDVEFIPTPMLADATVDPATFYSGAPQQGLFISKKAWNDPAKRPEIIKLVDFMLSSEVMNANLQSSRVVTLNYEGRDNTLMTPVANKLEKSEEGRSPVISHYTEITDAGVSVSFKRALDELFIGVISPQEFTDQVQETFDEVE